MENFNNLFTAKTVKNECVSGLIFDKNFDFSKYEYFVITSENMKILIDSFKIKEDTKAKSVEK